MINGHKMNIKDIWQKMVGNEKQRNYAANNDNHTLLEEEMKQARTLNDKELNLLLLYTSTRKYAERDRAMLLLTYWAGMRIGEVAATKIKDVLAADGTIKGNKLNSRANEGQVRQNCRFKRQTTQRDNGLLAYTL